MRQCMHLAPHAPPYFHWLLGGKDQKCDGGRQGDSRDTAEYDAPADMQAKPVGERSPDHRGDSQTGHHVGCGRGALLRKKRCGQERCHPEVGAVRQAAKEPESEQRMISGRPHCRRVAHRDQDHQHNQQTPPRPTRPEQPKDRRADHHSERVGTYGMRCDRFGNSEVCCVKRQQAHGSELRRADCEPAEGKSKNDEGYATR